MNKTQTSNATISNKPSLTVYKASAGSGKTFTLSAEYIKLLIANPNGCGNILAVTFTNKATEEMKMRILSQLYGLATEDPSSDGYMEKITQETGVGRAIVSRNAGIALRNIIHNYSFFRIETIDTFFQSILRNLARELDLASNMRIELNDKQVEQQAIDSLIDQLSLNDHILAWIMSYIKENIDSDKNWNVIGQIKRFGENIFKEYYKEHSESLNNVLHSPGFFEAYTKSLRSMMERAKKEMELAATGFNKILDENGLAIDDFNYGNKGVCGYFTKLSKGLFDGSLLTSRVNKVINDGDLSIWEKKTGKDKQRLAIAKSLIEGTLHEYLLDTEQKRKHAWNDYKSSELTLRHINQLRLLNCIENKVRAMNSDANRFLLSDTQTLLHKMMEGSDSPFIFEKIGARIEHIMIDEFQDTSVVQWKNFKVLMDECMSHAGSKNLIVGDVKQSIYRWRSGDWSLLNNIKGQFEKSKDSITVKTLDTNYRSERRVVEFNNAFFTVAANKEYESQKECGEEHAKQLEKAYQDVEQRVPSKKGNEGSVFIDLFGKDESTDDVIAEVGEVVVNLLEQGVEPSKIAILARSKAMIQQIADYFAENHPEAHIISDEAFRLDNSMAVNMIIRAMTLLLNPDDSITKAFIAKAYTNNILNKGISDNVIFQSESAIESYIPELLKNNEPLLSMPLGNLVERLIIAFDLGKLEGQSAYICAFCDEVRNFISENTADVRSFLEAWNESLHSKTIQANEVSGIRLITIHKSKGLEFDNVVIPLLDWNVDRGDVLWCSPSRKPYNELPLVPIDYSSKQLKGTIYENEYNAEHLQNCVDNLNLLYVAFTRASKNLFVLGKRGNKSTRSYIVEQCLKDVSSKLQGSVFEEAENSSGRTTLNYGTIKADYGNNARREATTNVFKPEIEKIDIQISPCPPCVEFRQSNQSRDFVNGSEDDDRTSYINKGKVLHKFFSMIKTADDTEHVVKAMELDGTLAGCGLGSKQITSMIRKRLEDPRIKPWFNGRWKLFNECTILSYDDERKELVMNRPDRAMSNGKQMVIVDFKFGNKRPEYVTQVRKYMALAASMGYHDVKGFLWFVYSNAIEEVK